MSAVGSRKVDAKGRSTGARKTNKRTRIEGQFAARLIDMLRSPAYRALSLSAHRLLARLEIELADHGGTDNGRLPCTYDDFERYGLHRHAIAPAIREAEVLGFIEVTESGRAGNAEWRRPTLFRLTYKPAYNDGPTDEWRRVTEEAAQRIAKFARAGKQNPSGGNRTKVQCGKRTTKGRFHSADSTTTGVSADSGTTIDIYPVGGSLVERTAAARRERDAATRRRLPAAFDSPRGRAVRTAYRTLAAWTAVVLTGSHTSDLGGGLP